MSKFPPKLVALAEQQKLQRIEAMKRNLELERLKDPLEPGAMLAFEPGSDWHFKILTVLGKEPEEHSRIILERRPDKSSDAWLLTTSNQHYGFEEWVWESRLFAAFE